MSYNQSHSETLLAIRWHRNTVFIFRRNTMKNIIIYGAGGLAKEIAQLIEDINEKEPTWHIRGFIDDINDNHGKMINGYKVLGTGEVLKDINYPTYVILGMSDPAVKQKINQQLKDINIQYATLIHPTAKITKNVLIGEGTVIGIGCILSTDVIIGDHVFLNMQTIVGHDTVIKNFSSCLVNTIISGNVTINEAALLGSGCIILEKKVIGAKAKISMGSLVNFDVEAGSVVMSRPSKMMKF